MDAKKKRLIACLKSNLSVKDACIRANVKRPTFYRWLHDDPAFARQVALARRMAFDAIEDLVHTKMVEKIRQGDMRAIGLWIKNHPKEQQGLKETFDDNFGDVSSDSIDPKTGIPIHYTDKTGLIVEQQLKDVEEFLKHEEEDEDTDGAPVT